MPEFAPIRFNQTGLRGRTARVAVRMLTDDAGVPADIPDDTSSVVIMDDTPNPTLTLRVHPVCDATQIAYVRFDQLVLPDATDEVPE